jgi:hypothetical protein
LPTYEIAGGEVTLNASHTLGSAEDLLIKSSGTLTIAKGIALTFNDNSTLRVDEGAKVDVKGTLNLGATGTGISTASYLKGTINVQSGGTLADKKTGKSAAVWNGVAYYDSQNPSTGQFVIYSGATVSNGGSPVLGTNSLFTLGSSATFILRACANTLPTYEIAGGEVTLNVGHTLDSSEDLLIKSSGKLIIPKNVPVTVNGAVTVESDNAITGKDNGGTIKTAGSGTVTGLSVGKISGETTKTWGGSSWT